MGDGMMLMAGRKPAFPAAQRQRPFQFDADPHHLNRGGC